MILSQVITLQKVGENGLVFLSKIMYMTKNK